MTTVYLGNLVASELLQRWAEAERRRDSAAMALAIALRDGDDYTLELNEFKRADKYRDEARADWTATIERS